MAGYRPYPEYRDSDVSWLCAIPKSWEINRLKFTVNLIGEKLDADTSALDYMGLEHIESWSGKRVEDVNASSEGIASRFLPGDVLFGKLRPYLAKVYLAEHEGLVSTEALVLRPTGHVHEGFLRYYMVSRDFIRIVDSSTYGSKMPRASWNYIGNLPMLLPEYEEQQTIARFLDHKTAQIDALIAKKEALLEKLAEKRTALISHAVTKGLNPQVKMKDSGVEWLGQVPEHWEIAQFSHFIYFQEGPGIMASDFTDEGTPLLRISNLKQGFVDIEGCNFISPQKVADKWNHFKLDLGDLLISSSASTGLVSIVSDSAAGSIPYTGIIRLRPGNSSIISDYIRIVVGSELFFTQINMLKTGTTIQHYGPAHLRQMRITLPPVDEQNRIFKYVDMVNKNIEKMQNKVLSAIENLKEYRSALITQAVTGKIDVRRHEVSLKAC